MNYNGRSAVPGISRDEPVVLAEVGHGLVLGVVHEVHILRTASLVREAHVQRPVVLAGLQVEVGAVRGGGELVGWTPYKPLL